MPLYAYDRMRVSWGHDGHKHELELYMVKDAKDPRSEDIKMLFWGKKLRAAGGSCYETGEEALRDAVSKLIPDKDVVRSIRAGSPQAKLRIDESDGLFDIYEDVGSDGSPQWQLKYLGVEPDGLAPSLGDDLDPKWCVHLIRGRLEFLSLYVAERLNGVSTAGKGAIYDSDGIILADQDTIVRETGCEPGEWHNAAVSFFMQETYRFTEFVRGNVFRYILYERDADGAWAIGRNDAGVYGSDMLRSGLADEVGHGLPEAISAGEYEVSSF